MKNTLVEIALNRWPYGLELRPSANGLLLRPRRKARANRSKAFQRPLRAKDDLADTRKLANTFDQSEWQW